MARQDDLLSRFDDTLREGMATQARAYRQYGALLGRFASRDVAAAQFARESADLYIETMGELAATGVKLAEGAMRAGVRGVDAAASAAAEAIEGDDKKDIAGGDPDQAAETTGTKQRSTRKRRAGSAASSRT